MWLLVSIFDSRRASFEPRRVDTHQWLAFVAYALLAAAGAWLCVSSPVTSRDWLLRWLGGAVFAYALMDGAASFSRAAHALFGVRLPPIHNHPILARSVSEFWNRRWNIIVHEMLDRHCFRPLARRGWVRLGMLAAFATSALIHFWIVVPPLGVRWAGVMAAFFAIQGAIVMLERKLAIARLRPGLAHTWTVAALLLSSPLFIEPFVRIMLG
jgi:D-alanyl-lipoteichoic acid acyltransferase DltB (MBOAT superfamily)